MYAVEAENLTKRYRVYLRPLDRLKEAFARTPRHHLVEALTDVSFRVEEGDTLGIIGENGAGKSTLLKILAGTVQPTAGRLTKQGRVAALLELGTGFHPEFSGRENITLNAALLGLSAKEIRERESAIIEFAELKEVIDLPVKTYSSGMYVRLAFSIATSVDPDVLIIDEALSVGDQRFQQKCVDRMAGFRKSGKTIIFCSHSMYLVNELCATSIWLARGVVRAYGKTSNVVSDYLAYMEGQARKDDTVSASASPEGSALPDVMIQDLCLLDDSGRPLQQVRQFQTVVIRVKTRCIGQPLPGHLGVGLEREDGQIIFATTTKNSGLKAFDFSGEQVMELVIPSFPLLRGSYRLRAVVADVHTLRSIHEASGAPFRVDSDHPEFGVFWIEHLWRFPDG